MDNNQFDRLKRLFDAAFGLQESERSAFLDHECADDPELREAIERLLAQPTQHEDFERLVHEIGEALPTRHIEPAPTVDSHGDVAPRPAPRTPSQIGPYRLLEKIGEGGMGEVWVAEQTEPVKRRVALKLIKRGMDSDQVVARFEAERQALAMMDHPAIAKVFDAGQTDDGRPFFVMEFVDGLAITEHCDKHKLTTRERLDLFVLVCEGIQHAHQKAIIHRDIKPTNVLVTLQDDRPVPKIIDFGVAKAIEQRLTERSLYTELGALVGTPAYMSPEQADLTGTNIDTRTDVYALGVLLYELLTGVLPFDPRDLREAGFDEIIRKIREDDPLRPSARVSGVDKLSTLSANNRGSEPGTLTRQIRGDLDWITMRALEKDRARRYGSASDLAMEIGRYLRDEPVLAGPPSGIYRARKYIKRHRVAVTVATLLAVMLVAFSIVTTIQSRRIAREAATAEQVSEFLVGLFEVSNPSESRGNRVTAREILDKGAKTIDTDLADQPEVQARMMHTIGRVYDGLGLYSASEAQLRKSFDRRTALLGPDARDTLRSMADFADAMSDAGRREDAERILADCVERCRRVLGADDKDTLTAIRLHGAVLRQLGRNEQATELLEEALELSQAKYGIDHPRTAGVIQSLTNVYFNLGDYEKVETINREQLVAAEARWGADHPTTLWWKSNLAAALSTMGRPEDALALDEEVLTMRRKVFGADHPDTASSLSNLGVDYMRLGEYERAEPLFREGLEIRRRTLGDRHLDTAKLANGLGKSLTKMERFEEAVEFRTLALEITRQALGDRHPDTAGQASGLGWVLTRIERFDEAEEFLALAVDIRRDALGVHHDQTLQSLDVLAWSLWRAGKHEEALPLYQEVIEVREQVHGTDDTETARIRKNFIALLRELESSHSAAGREGEAREVARLLEALERARQDATMERQRE